MIGRLGDSPKKSSSPGLVVDGSNGEPEAVNRWGLPTLSTFIAICEEQRNRGTDHLIFNCTKHSNTQNKTIYTSYGDLVHTCPSKT